MCMASQLLNGTVRHMLSETVVRLPAPLPVVLAMRERGVFFPIQPRHQNGGNFLMARFLTNTIDAIVRAPFQPRAHNPLRKREK